MSGSDGPITERGQGAWMAEDVIPRRGGGTSTGFLGKKKGKETLIFLILFCPSKGNSSTGNLQGNNERRAGGEGGVPQLGVVLSQPGQVPVPPQPFRTQAGPHFIAGSEGVLQRAPCPVPHASHSAWIWICSFLQPCFFQRKPPKFQSKSGTLGCSWNFMHGSVFSSERAISEPCCNCSCCRG